MQQRAQLWYARQNTMLQFNGWGKPMQMSKYVVVIGVHYIGCGCDIVHVNVMWHRLCKMFGEICCHNFSIECLRLILQHARHGKHIMLSLIHI